MACDDYFKRCFQNRFNTVFDPKHKGLSDDALSAGPHRLVGAEIWWQGAGSEEMILEGVTGIEFYEDKIAFRTVLGETLSLDGELSRVTLTEDGFVFRFQEAAKRPGKAFV